MRPQQVARPRTGCALAHKGSQAWLVEETCLRAAFSLASIRPAELHVGAAAADGEVPPRQGRHLAGAQDAI
eukprot:11209643-Lingulodinium_polyedra.AAC.1